MQTELVYCQIWFKHWVLKNTIPQIQQREGYEQKCKVIRKKRLLNYNMSVDTRACHILGHRKLNHVSFLLCAGQNPTTIKAKGWLANGLDSGVLWKTGEQSWI